MKQHQSFKNIVVDAHVHCFPDALAKKALPRLAAAAKLDYYADGTLFGVQTSMRQAGVDISVICNIAVTPKQMHAVNDFALAIDTAPGIVALGSVHPAAPDWEAELHRIAEGGLRGIKLHPEYQQVYVDDPRAIAVYRKCVELGLCIMFHSGVDLGLPGILHCTPQRFSRVMQLVDTRRFTLAHLGGYELYDQTAKYLYGQPVNIDISFAADDLPPATLAQLILAYGPDRVLFATDSPWKPQDKYLALVRDLDLPPQVRADLLGNNALRWLGIQPDSAAPTERLQLLE